MSVLLNANRICCADHLNGDPSQRIVNVGYDTVSGERRYESVEQVAQRIIAGERFVSTDGLVWAPVEVDRMGPHVYLRSKSDGTLVDNLSSLGSCSRPMGILGGVIGTSSGVLGRVV